MRRGRGLPDYESGLIRIMKSRIPIKRVVSFGPAVNHFYYLSVTSIVLTVAVLIGCKSFKYGYTSSKAENAYHLITGDKNNFGDKRLDYTRYHYRNSELGSFLNCSCNDRGLPSFIYEYRNAAKHDGVKLFYPERDSVFIFEAVKRYTSTSVLKEARKMDGYERETYERLKKGI